MPVLLAGADKNNDKSDKINLFSKLAKGLPLIGSIAQLGLGAYQADQRRKAEQELERFASTDKVNESIKDFYNKAYNRYAPNAYQSAEYNQQARNIGSSLASGLNAAQDRRGALAALPGLVQGANRAYQGAAASAEARQAAALSQLGGAASAKAREEQRVYANKFGLLAQKAAQKARTQNTLMQGGLKSLADAASIYAYGEGYSGNKKKKNGSETSSEIEG